MTLRNTIHDSVQEGLKWAATFQPGTTTEIDVLFALFTHSLREMDERVDALLNPIGLSCRFAGIYCHQSPKVIFEGRHPVELGDLLIACRYSDSNTSANNAVLLQTKVCDKPTYAPGDQLDLYTHWPRFTWTATKEHRRVTPPRAHRGAQYGFIDVCDESCPQCGIRTAVAPSTQAIDIADELMAVMMRASGRPFVDYKRAKRGRNWDRVIWDLLLGTTRRADFIHSRADKMRHSRRFDDAESFVNGAGMMVFSNGHPPPLLLTNAGAPQTEQLDATWCSEPLNSSDGPPHLPAGPDPTVDLPGFNAISTIFVDMAPIDMFD